jgi:hypothetical protein
MKKNLFNPLEATTGTKTGMDDCTPSYSQYFSWINNTNEGSTEQQTLVNLEFFKWLFEEYGMILDIYAFDAGNLDGPNNRYGDILSNKFRSQFPNGFKPLSEKAAEMKCRLGMWGGPDGYGDTPEEEQKRHDLIVSLCKDYHFALFKIDGVCGRLRISKQDAYIKTLKECREYESDLIVLNHRLRLGKAFPYVTTYLLEGHETYVDIHMANRQCAPHHREENLARAPPEGLIRMKEDHGVCISSCNDYWEDDLILQAFNRCLILAPEIYGNPWLLPDRDYPKLARIYNLHRRYKDILVNGTVLPAEQYGKHAISRGDDSTRFLTLTNLSWMEKIVPIDLNESIGLFNKSDTSLSIFAYKFHPNERFLGKFEYNTQMEIIIPPFRSYLLAVSTSPLNEIGIEGCDYEIIQEISSKPIKIKLLGLPGINTNIKLISSSPDRTLSGVNLNGKSLPNATEFLKGTEYKLQFDGNELKTPYHRKIGIFTKCKVPLDAEALYETTYFATDNNALEIREVERVGPSDIPQVQKARDAFFEQPIMVGKGVWDKFAFDGDHSTFFRVYTRNNIKGRTLRIDFGEILELDRLNIWGNYLIRDVKLKYLRNIKIETSINLIDWEPCHFTFSEAVFVELNQNPTRYLRIRNIVNEICSIEGIREGKQVDRTKWRASNLIPHYETNPAKKAWKMDFSLSEIPKNSYLAIAVHGIHGFEAVVASFKIDGKLYGCPDRAPSYPSNCWESWWRKSFKNYTFYLPLTTEMKNKPIEAYILGLKRFGIKIKPEIWITSYPAPFEEQVLIME